VIEVTDPAAQPRPRGWHARSARIAVHLGVLIAIPFACMAAFATAPWWSALFDSTVPRGDSSGLTDALVLVGAAAIALLVWVAAWAALGSPRLHAAVLVVTLLAARRWSSCT
jgi:hypothetical protein